MNRTIYIAGTSVMYWIKLVCPDKCWPSFSSYIGTQIVSLITQTPLCPSVGLHLK